MRIGRILKRGGAGVAGVGLAVTLTAGSCATDAQYGCSRVTHSAGSGMTSKCTRLNGAKQQAIIVLDYGAVIISSGWTASDTAQAWIPSWERHRAITDTSTDIDPN